MPALNFGNLQKLIHDETSFFSKLRGIPGKRKSGHVNIWTKSLELSEEETIFLYSEQTQENKMYRL